ncbi:MAG: transposase [Gemmatimonas sp.]|nr:transposase [Gemmatimonas sp.]MCA2996793.1 transposase [Gemmatimonas sp.]
MGVRGGPRVCHPARPVYCARNPVALEGLTYDRSAQAVTYPSDKWEWPTTGPETVDPLAFLARVLVHIPDKGPTTTRYEGWYATRPRGIPAPRRSLRRSRATVRPRAIAPAHEWRSSPSHTPAVWRPRSAARATGETRFPRTRPGSRCGRRPPAPGRGGQS